MHTVYSNPRLLAFQDDLAPYRGIWVVYSSTPSQGFIACHEVKDESQTPRLLEQISLQTLDEVRQFAAHLNVHGWHTSHTLTP